MFDFGGYYIVTLLDQVQQDLIEEEDMWNGYQ